MLDWMQELVTKFGETLVEVLPTSPFRPFVEKVAELPYLGILNWFIPVATLLKIGTAWLTAIALFYVYSIVMRWIKMIGD